MYVHMQVTLMDYFADCGNGAPLPSGPYDGPSPDPRGTTHLCSIDGAMHYVAPFLSYAQWLLRVRNRTVLVDTGLGLAFPGAPNATQNWGSTELHTELEIEEWLRQGTDLLSVFGGNPDADWGTNKLHRQ